jgi:GT2 family glycosyltransferase
LQAAAAEHLGRLGLQARVETLSSADGLHRVVYELPAVLPLVSVIVPTRDRPELLRVCADAVLQQTHYPHLELLIVDNGTTDPAAVALLDTLARDCRVTVIRHDGPFNWSVLNNAGAARAAGDVILFLNNDVAVLQPDWLSELVAQVLQPEVGAVGAKLLYPDGSIQHAGLTTDALGFPRHLFRHAPGDDAGPSELMGLARDVWAVTGACMATRREVFFAVGGLNEALPVTCNDVDFCLRLTANGYRLIWTPWAVLEHRELASRPPDHSTIRKQAAAEELDRLHRDWGVLVQSDPFLHPALELIDEQPCFRLRHPGDTTLNQVFA